jgi:serine/threonine protein kinase
VNEELHSGQALGTVFEGMYRIVARIGEGGMGTVYEAMHLRLHKRVAVKVMARELADSPEALGRFHREAMVTSALGHPHIVQVMDFSTTPTGEPFLVMEFLEGEDLDKRLRCVGRLSPADTVHVVKQVASALAATHAKSIVHRDLKPANIYLLNVTGETDFVKVLDFGISKVRAATTKLTKTTTVMGTPNYMSPEQALGRIEEIDERTDQWALACITWECLTGEGPFVGDNAPSILYQVVHEPPAPLASKVADLPGDVEEVLRCALTKDKQKRFASVAAFASALEAAITVPSQVHRPKTAPSVSSKVRPADTTVSEAAQTDAAPATTFTSTIGEVGDRGLTRRIGRKRVWVIAGGAIGTLSLAGFLVLRPGADVRPHASPVPAASAPEPAHSPVPAPAPAPPHPAAPAPVPEPVPPPTPIAPPTSVEPPTQPAEVNAAREPPTRPAGESKRARARGDKAVSPASDAPSAVTPTRPPPSAPVKTRRRLIKEL